MDRAAEFPRWRDLHHFFDIISESFTDAKKLEDVVKVGILSPQLEKYTEDRRLHHLFRIAF